MIEAFELHQRGDQADIVCNECDAVVRSVPVAELQPTFTEMELTLDVCTQICPDCGAANVFAGFSVVMAFTCRQCGKPVSFSDDPRYGTLFREGLLGQQHLNGAHLDRRN